MTTRDCVFIGAALAVVAAAVMIHLSGGFTPRQTRVVGVAVLIAALLGAAIGIGITPNVPIAPPASDGSCWACGTPTQQP